MFKALKRLICNHQFWWSERRQAEVCYRCGQSRKVFDSPGGGAGAGPL